MTDFNRISAAVCSLSALLGPSPLSSFTRYFDSDNSQSVQLIIEKLLKQNLLKLHGNLITNCSKDTDVSLLFKLHDSTDVREECLRRDYVRAVENLIISKAASIRESSIHHFLSSGRIGEIFAAESERMFLLTRALLLKSSLFITASKSILVNTEIEKAILKLDRLSLAAAVIKNETGEDAQLFLGDLTGFLKKYSADKSSLKRIIKLCLIKNNCNIETEKAFTLLTELKIFVSQDKWYHLNRSYLEEETEGSVICDSDFSIRLTGSPDINSRIHIYCDIVKCDRITEYNLNKTSFFRALDEGLTTGSVLKELNNPPYRQTLESWEESYGRIRIYSGTVVSCSQDTAMLITGIPEISSCIVRKITDTVFLMSTENYNTWSSRLSAALDVLSLPKAVTEEKESSPVPEFKQVEIPDFNIRCSSAEEDCVLKVSENQENLTQAFKGLNGNSKSGMDYRGKLAILKDAVKYSSQSVLLMELLDERTVVAKPVELTKDSTVDYLLFKNLFSGEDELIKAGSIYSLKLVKLPALQ